MCAQHKIKPLAVFSLFYGSHLCLLYFFCCSASFFFFFSKGCVCRAPCAPSQQDLKIHSLHLPCFSQPTHTSLNMSAETRARLPSQENYTDDTSTSQIHPPARRKDKRICCFPSNAFRPSRNKVAIDCQKATDMTSSPGEHSPTCLR